MFCFLLLFLISSRKYNFVLLLIYMQLHISIFIDLVFVKISLNTNKIVNEKNSSWLKYWQSFHIDFTKMMPGKLWQFLCYLIVFYMMCNVTSYLLHAIQYVMSRLHLLGTLTSFKLFQSSLPYYAWDLGFNIPKTHEGFQTPKIGMAWQSLKLASLGLTG